MEKRVKDITNELIALEPSLKNKKEELEKAVHAMLLVKPNIEVSADFKDKLKAQLNQKIAQKTVKAKTPMFDLSSISKLISAFIWGGAVVASVFVFGVMPGVETTKEVPQNNGPMLMGINQAKENVKSVRMFDNNSIVEDLADEAFDEIMTADSVNTFDTKMEKGAVNKAVLEGKYTYKFTGDFEIPKEAEVYVIDESIYPFIINVDKKKVNVTLTKEDVFEKIKSHMVANKTGENKVLDLREPVIKMVKEWTDIVPALVFYVADIQDHWPLPYDTYISFPLYKR